MVRGHEHGQGHGGVPGVSPESRRAPCELDKTKFIKPKLFRIGW